MKKKTALILLIGLFLSACSRPEINHTEARQRCKNLIRENVFWRVLNSEDPENLPDVPEKMLGVMAFGLLSPLFELEDNDKLSVRETALALFHMKYSIYTGTGDNLIDLYFTIGTSEEPGERLQAMQELFSADRMVLDFLEARLNDEERMTAFFRGEEIPLQNIPPCCASYL